MTETAIYKGFTAAQLKAAFDKIAPAPNWKFPINAIIAIAEFELMDAAAIFYTGGGLTRGKVLNLGQIKVAGAGYYANVGA